MAVGTWVLAIVTMYYSRKMFKISSKKIERPQIIEFISGGIFPILEQLEQEIKSLEKKFFRWFHKRMTADNVAKIENPLIELYAYRFQSMISEIRLHNKLIQKLHDVLKDLDKTIYDEKFEKECRALIEKYNKELREGNKIPMSETSGAPERFVGYIIDNQKELPKENPFHDFWKKYGGHFLSKRESDSWIKSKVLLVDCYTDLLISESKELFDKLCDLMDKLRKDYQITTQEIKESRSRLDMW